MHFDYGKLSVFLGVTEAEFVGSAASSGSSHWFLTLTHAQNGIFSLLFVNMQIPVIRHESTYLFLVWSDCLS